MEVKIQKNRIFLTDSKNCSHVVVHSINTETMKKVVDDVWSHFCLDESKKDGFIPKLKTINDPLFERDWYEMPEYAFDESRTNCPEFHIYYDANDSKFLEFISIHNIKILNLYNIY
jgi:hypothetical protein